MENIFKKLDLFGVNCSLLMNTKKRNSSWIGGIIVLLMLCVCILFVIYQFYQWLSTGNVTKFFQYNYLKKPEIHLGDYDDFMLIICTGSDNDPNYYDPLISNTFNETLLWEYNYRIPWAINGKKEIPLNQCSNSYIPIKLRNNFNKKNFLNCKCAKHEDLKNYNISFSHKDSYSTYLSFKVKFNDEIYKNLSMLNYLSKYIQDNPPRNYIYFVDSVADLNVFTEDFFTNYLNYHISYLSPGLYNKYDIYLNKISVIVSDSYIVNETPRSFYGITFERASNLISLYDNLGNNNNREFLRVDFRASNKIIQLYRNCMKFDEFLGNLLSIVIAIIITFQYINNFINEFEMKKMIINKIFRAYESSQLMMRKIRLIQEEFNEVNYNHTPPNFNDNQAFPKS